MVEFYDPHPGLAGCPVRLPEAVRLVADSLSGKIGSVQEAKELIIDAVDTDLPFEVKVEDTCILLMIGNFDIGKHCWNVIKYREVAG